jgi:hypothetical protein
LLKTIALILIAVAACLAGTVAFGAVRWRRGTRHLRAELEAARTPAAPVTYDEREIEGLPTPVRRYFQAVLRNGQRIASGARLSQEGEFLMRETKDGWRPFTADQVFTTRPPGFDWDARIRMAPGVNAFVHDAYVAGAGTLHAEVLGLVTVANVRGTPDVAHGELLRYLAEAVWLPTALLPSQGVRWEATGDATARATLTDGATHAALEFRFDGEGLVASVWALARTRITPAGPQPTPWQGRFRSYVVREGMRIPLEGEVEWLLAAGPLPYWRGRITEIAYQFAPER